jgi:diguanylate cyclase (GGDEF)-like protein
MKIFNSKIFIGVVSLLGIAIVGFFDFITGIEIRVYPLYFLPLVLAASSFGQRGAVSASIAATSIWFVSNFYGGHTYSLWYIWPINIFTQGIAFFIVSILVSSLKSSIAREQALSRKDTLTNLLNRRAFYEEVGRALALCHRKMRPATVAFMDLDNFKRINDVGGHQKGDELLMTVAETLLTQLRSSDIVARLGGDEFAIFLPEVDKEKAELILKKISKELQKIVHYSEFCVTASIGAVAFEEAPAHLGEMLKEADALMYSVKDSGKNGVRIMSGGRKALKT